MVKHDLNFSQEKSIHINNAFFKQKNGVFDYGVILFTTPSFEAKKEAIAENIDISRFKKQVEKMKGHLEDNLQNSNEWKIAVHNAINKINEPAPKIITSDFLYKILYLESGGNKNADAHINNQDSRAFGGFQIQPGTAISVAKWGNEHFQKLIMTNDSQDPTNAALLATTYLLQLKEELIEAGVKLDGYDGQAKLIAAYHQGLTGYLKGSPHVRAGVKHVMMFACLSGHFNDTFNNATSPTKFDESKFTEEKAKFIVALINNEFQNQENRKNLKNAVTIYKTEPKKLFPPDEKNYKNNIYNNDFRLFSKDIKKDFNIIFTENNPLEITYTFEEFKIGNKANVNKDLNNKTTIADQYLDSLLKIDEINKNINEADLKNKLNNIANSISTSDNIITFCDAFKKAADEWIEKDLNRKKEIQLKQYFKINGEDVIKANIKSGSSQDLKIDFYRLDKLTGKDNTGRTNKESIDAILKKAEGNKLSNEKIEPFTNEELIQLFNHLMREFGVRSDTISSIIDHEGVILPKNKDSKQVSEQGIFQCQIILQSLLHGNRDALKNIDWDVMKISFKNDSRFNVNYRYSRILGEEYNEAKEADKNSNNIIITGDILSYTNKQGDITKEDIQKIFKELFEKVDNKEQIEKLVAAEKLLKDITGYLNKIDKLNEGTNPFDVINNFTNEKLKNTQDSITDVIKFLNSIPEKDKAPNLIKIIKKLECQLEAINALIKNSNDYDKAREKLVELNQKIDFDKEITGEEIAKKTSEMLQEKVLTWPIGKFQEWWYEDNIEEFNKAEEMNHYAAEKTAVFATKYVLDQRERNANWTYDSNKETSAGSKLSIIANEFYTKYNSIFLSKKYKKIERDKMLNKNDFLDIMDLSIKKMISGELMLKNLEQYNSNYVGTDQIKTAVEDCTLKSCGYNVTDIRQLQNFNALISTSEGMLYARNLAAGQIPDQDIGLINQSMKNANARESNASLLDKAANAHEQNLRKGSLTDWFEGLDGKYKTIMMLAMAYGIFKNPKVSAMIGAGIIGGMAFTKTNDPLELVSKLTDMAGGGVESVATFVGLSRRSEWNYIPKGASEFKPNNEELTALTYIESLPLDFVIETLGTVDNLGSLERSSNLGAKPQLEKLTDEVSRKTGKHFSIMGVSYDDLAKSLYKMIMIRGAWGDDETKKGASDIGKAFKIMQNDAKTYRASGDAGLSSITLANWMETKVKRSQKGYLSEKVWVFAKNTTLKAGSELWTLLKNTGKTIKDFAEKTSHKIGEATWDGFKYYDEKTGSWIWFFQKEGPDGGNIIDSFSAKFEAGKGTIFYDKTGKVVDFTVLGPAKEVLMYSGLYQEPAWSPKAFEDVKRRKGKLFDTLPDADNRRNRLHKYVNQINSVLSPLGNNIENADEDFNNYFLGIDEGFRYLTRGESGAFKENRAIMLFRAIKMKLLLRVYTNLNNPKADLQTNIATDVETMLNEVFPADKYSEYLPGIDNGYFSSVNDLTAVGSLVDLMKTEGFLNWFNNVTKETNPVILGALNLIGVEKELKGTMDVFTENFTNEWESKYKPFGQYENLKSEEIFAQTTFLFYELMHNALEDLKPLTTDKKTTLEKYAYYLQETIFNFMREKLVDNTPTSWHVYELRNNLSGNGLKTINQIDFNKITNTIYKLSVPINETHKIETGTVSPSLLIPYTAPTPEEITKFETSIDEFKNTKEKEAFETLSKNPNKVQDLINSINNLSDAGALDKGDIIKNIFSKDESIPLINAMLTGKVGDKYDAIEKKDGQKAIWNLISEGNPIIGKYVINFQGSTQLEKNVSINKMQSYLESVVDLSNNKANVTPASPSSTVTEFNINTFFNSETTPPRPVINTGTNIEMPFTIDSQIVYLSMLKIENLNFSTNVNVKDIAAKIDNLGDENLINAFVAKISKLESFYTPTSVLHINTSLGLTSTSPSKLKSKIDELEKSWKDKNVEKNKNTEIERMLKAVLNVDIAKQKNGEYVYTSAGIEYTCKVGLDSSGNIEKDKIIISYSGLELIVQGNNFSNRTIQIGEILTKLPYKADFTPFRMLKFMNEVKYLKANPQIFGQYNDTFDDNFWGEKIEFNTDGLNNPDVPLEGENYKVIDELEDMLEAWWFGGDENNMSEMNINKGRYKGVGSVYYTNRHNIEQIINKVKVGINSFAENTKSAFYLEKINNNFEIRFAQKGIDKSVDNKLAADIFDITKFKFPKNITKDEDKKYYLMLALNMAWSKWPNI